MLVEINWIFIWTQKVFGFLPIQQWKKQSLALAPALMLMCDFDIETKTQTATRGEIKTITK